MSGDNKLFTAVSAALFSPATITKKSPKNVRYDPITHDRIVYDNSSGVMKPVTTSQPFGSVYKPRQGSKSGESSPFQRPGPKNERSPFSQTAVFSLNSSGSVANITYAKTRKRTEYSNPITGAKGYAVIRDFEGLESLGRDRRVVANQTKFENSWDLRAAYRLNRGEGDKITGAKKAPVSSVAYVNLYDLKG